ncbi:fimbrial biogenesis chaperone [Luteibacter yeojuensis]|uniref:Fimbria/pilus periplasmic chaperone n=1 Tax=Luteibacter yeojuensis TaxID=345309 RepID=A0A7X5QV59_9GAMM|nr:fimbria/pilus periplasmic chaperone [Luteibacter yeojuensis]NID15882.1 fimbria/pilus periplasmic chaperone [Luteibacter yeojuensis]
MSRTLSAIGAVVLFAYAGMAHAAVVIAGTRVVFPAQARDVSLKVENKGTEPALVQAWIDDGDEASSPSTARAPFAITPPVFRIDPGHAHTLRIVHVGDGKPKEREALYWLNVLEIPPKPAEAESGNLLQFAFRHRLKLFHRPKGLSTAPERAASDLRWSVERDGGKMRLRVDNPSPYHVSFQAVGLSPGGKGDAARDLGGGMVGPGASTRFSLPDAAGDIREGKVGFVTINDFGAAIPGSAAIAP